MLLSSALMELSLPDLMAEGYDGTVVPDHTPRLDARRLVNVL